MKKSNPEVVCYGEILWDVFPDKKVIGGAPFNVAQRLHSQGHSVSMISKIGKDELGKEVLDYLEKKQFPFTGIQQTSKFKTGEVLVTLNESGSASYYIEQPAAWDEISFTPEAEALVKKAQVFIYGSLACRNITSKETVFKLLENSNFSVFDVNLRPPFYTLELLLQLMERADFVKMNDEELVEITNQLGGPSLGLEDQALWLSQQMKLTGLCITKGANGAFLLFKDNFYFHKGFTVNVNDTVGAGDSFLATLIGELILKRNNPNNAIERACAVGALVASKKGANCELYESEIESLIGEIKS